MSRVEEPGAQAAAHRDARDGSRDPLLVSLADNLIFTLLWKYGSNGCNTWRLEDTVISNPSLIKFQCIIIINSEHDLCLMYDLYRISVSLFHGGNKYNITIIYYITITKILFA